MRLTALIACLVATATPAFAQSPGPAAPREFRLVERFGVAHPDQVVEFDLGGGRIDPAATRMLDEAGKEVAFQALRGGLRVAISTDLPAHASRRWKLVEGRSGAEVPQAVRVARTDAGFEIGHEAAALRLPPGGGPVEAPSPAPIQGVRLRDGKWVGTGPNAITFAGGADAKVEGIEVRVVEPGPLVAVAEVAYRVHRPEISYGETVLAPAEEGLYVCRIRAEAGQPSLTIEEETDTEFSYRVPLSGLSVDRGRYRGHHASEARLGREPDGSTYRQSHARPALDATVDLPTDRDFAGRLPIWDPWIFDSGCRGRGPGAAQGGGGSLRPHPLGRRMPNPSHSIRDDAGRMTAHESRFRAYVEGVVGRFKDDPRVASWQLDNEAAGPKERYRDGTADANLNRLLAWTRSWVKATGTRTPATATGGGFYGPKYSDFYSYHSYASGAGPLPNADGGPEHLCTETLNRPAADLARCLKELGGKRNGSVAWESGIGRDGFSIRWTGRVVAPVTETYTVTGSSDGVLRAWVGEVEVIDKGADGRGGVAGKVELTRGESYPIRAECVHRAGEVGAHIDWSGPKIARRPLVPGRE